jgi:hypothetical protein
VPGNFGYWKVWNKDANQDCKVDSVVFEHSQSQLWWPWKDLAGRPEWFSFNDSYTNLFSVELTRFQTDGTLVSTNGQYPSVALKLQEATGSVLSTKQIGIFINLARPKNSILTDPVDHLQHSVIQYAFDHVGPLDVWGFDRYNAKRWDELNYDIQVNSGDTTPRDTWASGQLNLWYITTLDVHTGSGVAFHGQLGLQRGYRFWYITSDSNWVKCQSDILAIDVP